MIDWGVNALNHGSSLAVFKDGVLISNSFDKSDELSKETLQAALRIGNPDRVYWYENPWHKKGRQIVAGQWRRALDMSVLPSRYLKNSNVPVVPVTYTPHHASHAAAGYYTSPFNHCAIVVLDAIGEFECASIWEGRNGHLKKLWSRSYPNSLGLFYSAFTQLCGFTPILEEHRLQQLAEQGDPEVYYSEVRSYFDGVVSLNRNLHKGVQDWPHKITPENTVHIAAAVQQMFEEQVVSVMSLANRLTNSNKLVYMGGCAMNSKANKLFENEWKHIWSVTQPGDPSSSIGAVLYHTKRKLKWTGPLAKHIAIKV